MAKEVAEEYASSLADLTVNSKPLINMLTILAEENIDHAGVIVDTVEKHLEKVHPDIKLPVLYLVDSIIKNVGGAYTQKFAQSIVNMFTRTFKLVDEKVRSQMFKLRETWHDVFPATKLYQLDVKVNLIDPAWPIQAQPHQSNIHQTTAVTSTSVVPPIPEDEKMRSLLAKKEQELLMLQRKKIEMELEQTRKQLEVAEKTTKKVLPTQPPVAMPIALVNPVVAAAPTVVPEVAPMPVKARLGPPVAKVSSSAGRIAPVSGALAAARRDPRLARRPLPPANHPPHPPPPPAIAPNVFDIKPLERVTKRKNVITIDVRPDGEGRVVTDLRRVPPRDPRLDNKRDDRRERKNKREERRQNDDDKIERNDKKKLDDERKRDEKEPENHKEKKEDKEKKDDKEKKEDKEKNSVDIYIDKFHVADAKKINKLPPIPKINRDEVKDKDTSSPIKRKKEVLRIEKKKKKDDTTSSSSKDNSSCGSSPDKRMKLKERKQRAKERRAEAEIKSEEPEMVPFNRLKNYNKERYMRRNREKSESPETAQEKMEVDKPPEIEPSNGLDIVGEKDVDLRVLPGDAAAIGQKRSSTETIEGKPKKHKIDKFDILFGNEDVDLRQLPQVEELPPVKTASPESSPKLDDTESSPVGSPKKDWHDVKEKKTDEVEKKTPSKLDLVRAKLAEATKGKDRLGRPLLFSKSPSIEKERRRTISSEDTDLRTENPEEFDPAHHKKSISIIMNQAKEEFNKGQMDKNQYNTLMYQVLQLSEKLKLKEAKQRESLEISKRKLKAHIEEENMKVPPKSPPNTFGDIDERVNPVFMDTPPDSQVFLSQDSDMRMMMDNVDISRNKTLLPAPPMPMFMPNGPYGGPWRGPRPRIDEYVPRRFRAPGPPFYRGKYDKRGPRFDAMLPMPLPMPKIGMSQGECPLRPYERCESPPPLGAPGFLIPPTDYSVIDYIDQDPVKTIQIDGIPREIRFYGNTAVIMLDWDDPREIKFLPGCRRVTFDNKDSVVITFNEPYKQVEIDDQVFDIKFGAPTRELFINGRWFECFFGGQPLGVIIDGKPRLVHLEGPLPQVDIGKEKRTDLVAGKINLIVNATQMCPVYLDAKVQKFKVGNEWFTIRFVDSLRTVLINEQPFRVEYGDLPKPIFVGDVKYFIRFSALPRNIKPGFVRILNMEGSTLPALPQPVIPFESIHANSMEVDQEPLPRPPKTPSPEGETQGLDMLASVMPSNMETPASASEYSLAEPLFCKPEKIPGLETPSDEKPPLLPALGNINVTDLFAKLVATGIVAMPNDKKPEDSKEEQKVEEVKSKTKEDKSVITRVDLLRPETLRVKQPGIIAKLYGGMQCSGCGARFPPEHTVRYSQHLDWHFRQNRRERDSARRAHSRHWHYDLSDWVQYEEVEDLEEREKSWFETGGVEGESEGPPEPPEEAPSVAAGAPADSCCALCGDKFDQFYNEDKEEWHLRNSVRHEENNYHPLCFEDYKASLTKEEPPQEVNDEVIQVKDIVEMKEPEEAIEIREDDTASQSDNESVVEVLDNDKETLPETLEIDEGEEDDVVFKAEPVEEVVVQDDADTDDETTASRAERDRRAEIDFSQVKVKQEPIDPDDEPIITAEEETVQPSVDTTHTTVLSSIDGNLQLDAASAPPTTLPIGGIRINISKTIPSFISNPLPSDDKSLEDISVDDEPLPPGEEPELEYSIKAGMEGVQFSRQPPVQKGSELSGLCSIM